MFLQIKNFLMKRGLKALAIEISKLKSPSKSQVEKLKRVWAKKYGWKKIPLNSEILEAAPKSIKQKLLPLLITKPTRTISGVAVIAIMAKPAPCPGTCIYCPRGPFAPQSYTGFEPAAMRAIANKFDPYAQVVNRLKQLEAVGHPTDKCELIIMGGTFPALSWKYQRWFVKRAFDAFNGFDAKSLAAAQKANERAVHRVIGLTIESRPDYVFPKRFLTLGCTRVELGVQTVYNSILKKIVRGHDVAATVKATAILKDHAFKILYHLMPGLPGSNFKKDLNMFKKVFNDPRFRPDMLKIYPTLVIKGTKLYEMWKKGQYSPIDEKYMLKLLRAIFEMCPPWVRIMRVQRDIPAQYIEAGPKLSNLRQILIRQLEKEKVKCAEIRFREAGHVWLRRGELPENVELLVRKYRASGGTEYFISAEDVQKNILLGFCRLRLCDRPAGLVRELHVYGAALPIAGPPVPISAQHRGWGRRLLAEAERLAAEKGYREIWVISGIGVREYYRKLGYRLKKGYMVKRF